MSDSKKDQLTRRGDTSLTLRTHEEFSQFLGNHTGGLISRILLSTTIADAQRRALQLQVEKHMDMMRQAFDVQLSVGQARGKEYTTLEIQHSANRLQEEVLSFQEQIYDRYIEGTKILEARRAKLPPAIIDSELTRLEMKLKTEIDDLEARIARFGKTLEAL